MGGDAVKSTREEEVMDSNQRQPQGTQYNQRKGNRKKL